MVFVFLRNGRATLIPSVAVPVSLIGTFAVMYLLGYSLDNLSLMALTISTGFVVDDAIVVMENIARHLEQGMEPFAAALKGAQEIGFTVFSISVSLIAVFIPILMMGGIVGRLFREFAITLSTAIVVSMVISLTTTPTMCAYLLKAEKEQKHGRIYQASEKFFAWMLETYRHTLLWAARQFGADAGGAAAHHRFERRAHHQNSQRFFPAAGYRGNRGRRARSAGCFVCRDGQFDPAVGRSDQERSRGRQCNRLHWRQRRDQRRIHLHRSETAQRAQNQCRANHQPAASQN